MYVSAAMSEIRGVRGGSDPHDPHLMTPSVIHRLSSDQQSNDTVSEAPFQPDLGRIDFRISSSNLLEDPSTHPTDMPGLAGAATSPERGRWQCGASVNRSHSLDSRY